MARPFAGHHADHAIGRAGRVEARVDGVEQRRADTAAARIGAHHQRHQLVEIGSGHERRRPVRRSAAHERVAEVGAAFVRDQGEAAGGEDRLVHRPPHGPRRRVVDVRRELRRDRLMVGVQQQPERLEARELRGVELVEDHRGANMTGRPDTVNVAWRQDSAAPRRMMWVCPSMDANAFPASGGEWFGPAVPDLTVAAAAQQMTSTALTRRGFAVSAGRAAAAFALIMAEPWRLAGLFDEAVAATPAVGFADADYWAFIDPIVEHMDRLWDERDACYVISGAGETVINAALCTIHAVAAMSDHDGPSRNDARAVKLARRLCASAPWSDRRTPIEPDKMFHKRGLDREHAPPLAGLRQVDRPEGGGGARGRLAGAQGAARLAAAAQPDDVACERLRARRRSSGSPASA